MSENRNYTVPALEKGMKILEDLAASSEPLTITELAANQGKGRNEIYRMLCSLEALGYITREEATKRYSLSLKLFQVANRYPPLERLRVEVRGPLQDLADRIHESCHLCVLDGNALTVVAQASGSERIRIAFQLGARFDPLETCSGKLLLSELSGESRRAVLEFSHEFKQAKVSQREAWLEQLGKRPRQRMWEEDSQLRPGIRDVAVALGSEDTIHASIAVAHLTHRRNALSMSEIRDALKEAARGIEGQLGLKA
jgi:DNA-binding IclR family transcriptional regulator